MARAASPTRARYRGALGLLIAQVLTTPARADVEGPRLKSPPGGPAFVSAAPLGVPPPPTSVAPPPASAPPDTAPASAAAPPATTPAAPTPALPTTVPPAAQGDPVAELKRQLPFEIWLGALFYQGIPVRKADSSVTAMHFSYLTVEKRVGLALFHLEARFRDRKFRAFYESNVWLVESYARVDVPQVTKLTFGKIARRFGIHSDRTLVGNVQEFNGLKFNRDLGLSVEDKLEHRRALGSELTIDYALQYFPLDGGTNTALDNRGTLAVKGGGREKHIFNARVVPTFTLSESTTLALGVSAQQLRAEIPEVGHDQVRRLNAELTLQGAWAALYGEVSRQWGRSTASYPLPGASAEHLYLLGGVELKWRQVSTHLNVSTVHYQDIGVQDHEILHNVVLDFSPVFVAAEHWWLFQHHDRRSPGSSHTDGHSVTLFLGALF